MSVILKGINLPFGDSLEEVEIIFHKVGGLDYRRYIFANEALDLIIQIPTPHGRLKDFDGNGVHPIIVDGEYMIKVDDLGKMPTILEAEE